MPCQGQRATLSQVPVNHVKQIIKPVWNPPFKQVGSLIWTHQGNQKCLNRALELNQVLERWAELRGSAVLPTAESAVEKHSKWDWEKSLGDNCAEMRQKRELSAANVTLRDTQTYRIEAGWKLKAEGEQTFEKMGIASIFKAVKRPRRKRLWQEP